MARHSRHACIAVAAGAALLTACATLEPRSVLFDRVGHSDMTAGALRARVRDMARRFPGVLEATADALAERSGSPDMRVRMITFKSNAVPLMQGALLQPDPVAALVDAWALLAQLQDEVAERAAGAPPDQVAVAQRALSGLEGEVEALWRELAGRQDVSDVKALVHRWAGAHPLTGPLVTRESTIPLLAAVTESSRVTPLGAAASLLQDTRDITARIDLYAASLPKQARWQAEALGYEAASAAPVVAMVNQLGRAMDRFDQLGALATGAPGVVTRERTAVLEDLDRQRRETEGFVSSERQAVVAAARGERIALVDALHSERVATVDQVDQVGRTWVDYAFDRAAGLVDRVFLWLFALTAFVLVGVFTGATLLVRARRPREPGGRRLRRVAPEGPAPHGPPEPPRVEPPQPPH